jgi:hypothetical protein
MSIGGLGGKEWEELWATAEKYKVPIALRTVFPTRSQVSLAIFILPLVLSINLVRGQQTRILSFIEQKVD